MLIRKTLPEDVDTILNIFDTARQFMHATGNPTQWNANYPALEDLEPDIQNGNSYVCVENDKVVATFTLIIGDEPNYQLIENGSWRSEAPYGTVHRLASDGTTKGIARACFDFCKTQISHLRVDTTRIINQCRLALSRMDLKNVGLFTSVTGLRGSLMNLLGYLNREAFL